MTELRPRIHFAKHSDAAETVEMGEALCGAGQHSRTETEQYVTAIYDDVTCRNCRRIVDADTAAERAAEDAEPRHPRTDEPTNEARAARVHGAITAYAQHCYGTQADRDDLDTVAQDFLTDVFHWLRARGLDAADLAQRAANMVQAEVEQEN